MANTETIPCQDWLDRRRQKSGGSDDPVFCGSSRSSFRLEIDGSPLLWRQIEERERAPAWLLDLWRDGSLRDLNMGKYTD